MRRREAYYSDPTIQMFIKEKESVISHSSVQYKNGVICADDRSQALLDKLDALIANHIEAHYPETLLK